MRTARVRARFILGSVRRVLEQGDDLAGALFRLRDNAQDRAWAQAWDNRVEGSARARAQLRGGA